MFLICKYFYDLNSNTVLFPLVRLRVFPQMLSRNQGHSTKRIVFVS